MTDLTIRFPLWQKMQLSGVIFLSLIVSGCGSTNLTVDAPIETVEVPTEQLTVDPSLLVIQPLTPLPPARTSKDWREREKILDADNERDRGQFRELIGAVKQKEHDQKTLNDAKREEAKKIREAIEKANKEQTKVKKPFFGRVFGGLFP